MDEAGDRRDYSRAMSTEEPPPEQPGEPPSRPRLRGFRTGRLEAFSDGVFAIAVTLLVLDIGVSATAGRDLGGAIRGLWPSYLAYVASFSTIGAAWLGTTRSRSTSSAPTERSCG